MTLVHADHEEEQAYVSSAYRMLDLGHAKAEQNFVDFRPGDRVVKQAMVKALDILRNAKTQGQLIFGRVDTEADEPLYIGRRVVFNEDKDVLVVGWEAPAAQAYYEATPAAPGNVTLKRTFLEEDRRLVQIVDEIVRSSAAAVCEVSPSAAEGGAGDALLSELERSRDGAMRDVVATIQAEQYRIIRAPREGVLVVQGGPGTGKTVIGLHRAAWLALNDERLRREGLLIVSPNSALLAYTSGVLPTLGVGDLLQTDVRGLYVGEAVLNGVDDDFTARVKGAAAMAEVLRRALAGRIGWAGDALSLSIGPMRVSIAGADLQAITDDVRRRPLTHSAGRDLVRERLAALTFERYREACREAGILAGAGEAAIRRLGAFNNALDRMWPSFTPEEFLRNLYSTQTSLVAAAEGVLTSDERAALFRSQSASIADEPWTVADLFCLDEVSGLLNGPEATYGHVVVDEAQDLTPLQARALARRCPTGSFTILGDLAQATGAFIRDTWSELTDHLAETGNTVEGLNFCYRVPGSALGLAALQLPLIAPELTAPVAVRPGRVAPVATRVDGDDLITHAIRVAREAAAAGATTAVVVPDALYDDLLSASVVEGDRFGDGRSGDFAGAVSAVPASLAKGLEFDTVVVVAPERIVGDHVHGRRLLYIALTRCTQELQLVHSDDLPEGLDHLDDRYPGPPREQSFLADDVAPEELPSAGHEALEVLVARLDAVDRELVEGLVKRLLGTGTTGEAL